MPVSFSIIGAGRVATYVAVALKNAGYVPLSIFSSDGRSAGVLAQGLSSQTSGQVWSGDAALSSEIPIGDIVIIAVSDGSIASVDGTVSERLTDGRSRVILHTSGALSSEILQRSAAGGHAVGSMHPLQTFDLAAPSEVDAGIFADLPIAIEGDERAVQSANVMAKALGARPFHVRAETKKAYHAAAVMSSNFYSLLISSANELLPFDLPPEILEPLATQALKNVFAQFRDGQPGASMTGPVARGDVTILKAHLELISTDHPDVLKLYVALTAATAERATSAGILSARQHDEISALVQAYDRISRNQ